LASEAGGAFRVLNWEDRPEQARAVLQQIGARIDPESPVSRLSMAEQQLVEIARALRIDVARSKIGQMPLRDITAKDIRELVRGIEKRSPSHADHVLSYIKTMFAWAVREETIEQNPAKRSDLYQQAQQQILDDVAVIPIYHNTDYELVKPSVKGLAITAMGILRLETVWIER